MADDDDDDNDDVPTVFCASDEDAAEVSRRFVAEEEAKVEAEASLTGKRVERTIGALAKMEGGAGIELLRIRITCDPGQFAIRTVELDKISGK